jgi:hypothetical protein
MVIALPGLLYKILDGVEICDESEAGSRCIL